MSEYLFYLFFSTLFSSCEPLFDSELQSGQAEAGSIFPLGLLAQSAHGDVWYWDA